MKLSIVSKTFRIHDNPFLDSDIYIIYIDKKEYGPNQKVFLDQVLKLHLQDLSSHQINPIIITSLRKLSTFVKGKDIDIFVDFFDPLIKMPFSKFHYLPTWCLIDWTDKVDMIRGWFLPEGLKNHQKFKEYTIANKRNEYQSKLKKTIPVSELKSTYKFSTNKSVVPLPDNNLDQWVLTKLHQTSFMNNPSWFKPDTSPTTSLTNNSEYLPDILKSSKLSPYISLGVLSPVTAYHFYSNEKKMGSSRDQLLFREIFHACGQMPEYWDQNQFGQIYHWKEKATPEWISYINGTTGREDVDWAMKQLKNEGWIHHLARHLVADYLTRGVLEISWIEGMNWFKQTLVDHDKYVNRGNWMWLSGTAFSTKQRSFYHYNPDNYLKNKDKKLKVNKV